MKTEHHSYSKKMRYPIFRMYGRDGKCIASVRAWDLQAARRIFTYHGFTGNRVKKVYPRG